MGEILSPPSYADQVGSWDSGECLLTVDPLQIL